MILHSSWLPVLSAFPRLLTRAFRSAVDIDADDFARAGDVCWC